MRVGIVGCGGMGGVHANKYADMPEVEVCVFDLDTEKLQAFCTARNLKACGSFAELLASCEAVDVCLPTTAHRDVAIEALRAGKPTLVEKPMARTVEDCQMMIAAATQSGSILVPAHVVRFFPEYRAAHECIERGKIGKPASIRLRRGGGPPKMDWFLDLALSGGILLDLAVHEFDWLLWTLGPAATVMSRSVRLGDQVAETEYKGDYALTTITFVSGAVAHVESTWMDPGGFRVSIEASGSEGMVEFDSRNNPTLRAFTGTTATENNYAAADDPYFQQLKAFVEVASGKADPKISAEEGMAAVKLACAAIESAQTGQLVTI